MKKSLIRDPAMVSMTKTQLTIRQNVNKLKIQKFHFFSNFGLVLFVFLAVGAYIWVPDLVPLIKKFKFSQNLII